MYVRSTLLFDVCHLRTTPDLVQRLVNADREMQIVMVEGRAALHEVERRLPDAQRCRELGNTPLEPLIHRRQLRRAHHLCKTHRRRPNLVTMIAAGRIDPLAYPEAFKQQQQAPRTSGGRRNHHGAPHDSHVCIIRRIDLYMTPEGTQDATKAFFRQTFQTAYNDGFSEYVAQDELAERPLDYARQREAQCPHCQ
jgi:hypothetical protein